MIKSIRPLSPDRVSYYPALPHGNFYCATDHAVKMLGLFLRGKTRSDEDHANFDIRGAGGYGMNIYHDNIEEHLPWLDKDCVHSEVKPYQDYLKQIMSYRKNNPKIIDYEKLNSNDSECIIRIKTDSDNVWQVSTRFVYDYDSNEQSNTNDKGKGIKIKFKNKPSKTLVLERHPVTSKLKLGPNLNDLYLQNAAFDALRWMPAKEYDGILKLLHPQDHVKWPSVRKVNVDEWFVLTDADRHGTIEQRRFVEKALGTRDFAFLEGPPGSGKTTALCELIRQLVSRKKSILFCASTHVAVDNILERLMGEDDQPVKDLVPLRIGRSDKISKKIERFRYDRFVETTTKHAKDQLASKDKKSRAQEKMLEVLHRDKTIGRMALDCANLVCGTPIGIVDFPDIGNDAKKFDYMIIDEASKTTFREFLVPALYAKRWIIVGDIMQLAPYTDQDAMEENLKACVDWQLGQACVDTFLAHPGGGARLTVVVPTNDKNLQSMYRARCGKMGTHIYTAADNKTKLKHPCIILDSPAAVARMNVSKLPSKNTLIRNYDVIKKQKDTNNKNLKFWRNATHPTDEHTWAYQMAWRMALRSHVSRVKDEMNMLEPDDPTPELLSDVKKMSLPSLLESIQNGFGDKDGSTALDRGMAESAFKGRHVRLTWQHRMHEEIADFSHRHIYNREALRTPDSMESTRAWEYDRYKNRMVWIDVKTGRRDSGYSNDEEAKHIVAEMDHFVKWVEKNPRSNGAKWDVAVIAFYTKQESVLKRHLQKYAGRGDRTFDVCGGHVTINLRTLDSFQGHESDIVFLSLAHWRPTLFLNNPNRLNVGLTRARYQCVVVGDNSSMKRAGFPLGRLADEIEVAT